MWQYLLGTVKLYYSPTSLLPQNLLRSEMKASKEQHYQSQQHSQPAPCSSLQSLSPGAFPQCSPCAWLCWMRLGWGPPRIFKARSGQSAAWRPTDPAHLRVSVQGLPFRPKPPKGFLSLYPGMRSEFQIRIRVSVCISCIRYLLKHISPSLFLLSGFAGPPKRRFILCSSLPLSWRWVTHQR